MEGTSGVTHLLNRENKSRLELWKLREFEILRIVTEFESITNFKGTRTSIRNHQKDTHSFQRAFSSDVKMVVLSRIIYNLFEPEYLAKINNTNVTFIETASKDLSNLTDAGEKDFIYFEMNLLP